MQTTSDKSKVYVLELIGDPTNSSGSITISIGGTSLDLSKIEELKIKKDVEIEEYFSDVEAVCDCDDDECENNHDDHEWTYMNSDYSSRPSWTIVSYELL